MGWTSTHGPRQSTWQIRSFSSPPCSERLLSCTPAGKRARRETGSGGLCRVAENESGEVLAETAQQKAHPKRPQSFCGL